MRKLFVLLLILSVMAFPAMAQDEEPQSDFSTLLAALEAAGLTDTLADAGPFTIFAPTDEVFAAALDTLGLTAEELLADTETLTNILLYHVVQGELSAEDVILTVEESGGLAEVETLSGETITIEIIDGNPVINGVSTVFVADVPASNGVIHVIDAVLLPPSMSTEPEMQATEAVMEATEEAMTDPLVDVTEEAMMIEGTILDLAAANEDLSTLAAAVEAAELGSVLSSDGPLTVFAPTNAAFEAALADLGLTTEELLADTDTLVSILQYHVVADEFPSSVIVSEGLTSLDTAAGQPLALSFADDGTLLINETASVVTADVAATNGVIHVIDAVLLPPES